MEVNFFTIPNLFRLRGEGQAGVGLYFCINGKQKGKQSRLAPLLLN